MLNRSTLSSASMPVGGSTAALPISSVAPGGSPSAPTSAPAAPVQPADLSVCSGPRRILHVLDRVGAAHQRMRPPRRRWCR